VELNQIKYFLTLCRELNFTRAAETCNVSQPALTRAIKNLENELGGELFRRERGNTHLTDLGKPAKPHLEQVYNATQAVRQEAESFKVAAKAPLTLGVMCTISPQVIAGFLRAIREKLPTVDLTIVELGGDKLLAAVIKGEMDVAIVGMPDLPERLDPIPLYTERYGVAFAKGHRFERMNAVKVSDLDAEDYVQRTACEFTSHWTSMGMTRDIPVKVVFRSEREDWVQALLVAGFGCAVMPEFFPRLPGIVHRVLVEPEVSRTISLVTVAGRRFIPATKAVVQLARGFRWDTV
jgi:DNA-binding transcriptional LysR family regulator